MAIFLKILRLVPSCTNCKSEISGHRPPRTNRHGVLKQLDAPPPDQGPYWVNMFVLLILNNTFHT